MLQKFLENLLRAHGLDSAAYEDWVVVDGELPGIRASIQDPRLQDGRVLLRLDIEVSFGADDVIVESFAGVGEDREAAVANALRNFCVNALHVFLAAFWGHVEADQVQVESWQINGADWRAVIGNFGCQIAGDDAVDIPGNAFATIEACIKDLPLTGERHWVRSFYCNVGRDETGTEVLLDNEVWEDAQTAVAGLDWPQSDGYYSARNFLILQRS